MDRRSKPYRSFSIPRVSEAPILLSGMQLDIKPVVTVVVPDSLYNGMIGVRMRIAALVMLSLVSSTIGFSGTPFKGTVTDVSGGAIPGAMLLVHWDSAGSTVGLTSNVGIEKDLIVKADENGGFTAELPPGF